jgi:PAS domain S-box-containing protein
MEPSAADPTDEIGRLQRCISDLTSILALSAIWTGGESSRIIGTLADALRRMLNLDLVYVQVKEPGSGVFLEMARGGAPRLAAPSAQETREILAKILGPDLEQWRAVIHPSDGANMSIVPVHMGLHGDVGVIVAGSLRADFPLQTEKLLLGVAANQAAIGLQESWILSEQKRLASELDKRVAQRTEELAGANEELTREIDERRSIEERLRREERELRLSEARGAAILNSALDCIVTIDHDGCITEFNPAAERTFGYRRDDILGKQLADVIVPPAHREQHRLGLARYLHTGVSHVIGKHVEMTAMRADGTEFSVELAITRIPLDGPPAFTGYLRDITARKESEEKLRESEMNLRELTETIPEMLWRATPDGTIDYCNARVLHYTGFSAEEIMGDGWKKLLHPDDIDQAIRVWMSSVASGIPYRAEVRVFHAADRSYRWCVTSALPLRDQQGRILKWHGTVTDLHDWRQAQEELRKTQAELAHVTRVMTMGELTASIAHEVNQPLASIITNGETNLRRLARPEPDLAKAQELTTRMVADARRASEIIDRIRGMVTRRAPTQVPLSLSNIIQESLAFLRRELQSKDTTVSVDLEPIPQILGDRTQLQQVIVNLAINAVHAMDHPPIMQRGILIQTRSQEPGMVSFIMEDSGPGISPIHLPRIFDSFFTTKDTGMGMGLPICRSIIEAHGGQIQADNNSSLGGARFTFMLPAAEESPETI